MSFNPRPFRIAPWAADPHLQTLAARVLRSAHGPAMIRERWDLPDGDFLDVDLGPDPGGDAPLVLVLHGLEGSSRRRYVLSACREILARGMRPVAMNFRSCSGEMNRRPRMYHSGETGDPAFVLERLRATFPGRPLGGLGFSLGGNVLLKLLGEHTGEGTVLDAAVAISVPLNLAAGCRFLEETPMGRLYTRYFLRSLKAKVRAKARELESLVDMEATMGAPTLRAFDDAATARIHGFADADDYYARCSSARYLGGILTPTLVLHAVDDPFLPAEAIPREELQGNPAIQAHILPSGGHVGFLEGVPWAPRLWAEEEGARFLGDALLGG